MYSKATFAAGCFWGVEAAFWKVKGVISTRVGYTGGFLDNPTYEDVCGSDTGHAEAVEVIFDPKETSYEELVEVFWRIHDPTTLNRQGLDHGSQYRSAIFYHSAEQRAIAENSKSRMQESGRFGDGDIVTEIAPAGEFYEAEDYHQHYLQKKGGTSCRVR